MVYANLSDQCGWLAAYTCCPFIVTALTVHSIERSRFTSDSRVSLEKLAIDREVFAFATVNAESAQGAWRSSYILWSHFLPQVIIQTLYC